MSVSEVKNTCSIIHEISALMAQKRRAVQSSARGASGMLGAHGPTSRRRRAREGKKTQNHHTGTLSAGDALDTGASHRTEQIAKPGDKAPESADRDAAC